MFSDNRAPGSTRNTTTRSSSSTITSSSSATTDTGPIASAVNSRHAAWYASSVDITHDAGVPAASLTMIVGAIAPGGRGTRHPAYVNNSRYIASRDSCPLTFAKIASSGVIAIGYHGRAGRRHLTGAALHATQPLQTGV